MEVFVENIMSIQNKLIISLKNNFKNNAIYTYDKYYSYEELYSVAVNISNTLLNINYEKQAVIIMGMRSFYTHAAICGIIMAGSYYTPLNNTFPYERNINIIKHSKAKIIYLDYEDFSTYEDIINNINGYNIICPNEHIEFLSNKFKNHKFYSKAGSKEAIKVEDNDACYMLFTSGSTGEPKGIKLSQFNLESCINAFTKRNNVTNKSRFMQMNDLTFDLSIHSIFLAFLYGGCLYIPDSSEKLNPNNFINNHEINSILMVPSSLTLMIRFKLLKQNILPTLKYVSFCGEALPFDKALLMAKACPNAKLENLYGPTEATIACTYFEFNKDTEELAEYCGSMPIGKANDGMEVFIVDSDLNIINNEATGQLVLSGNQLAKGYLNNIEQTKEKFIKINGKDCYLTGDLCRYVDNQLVFLGRNDAQVQIRGYRVELYEIENIISKIDGVLSNAVIPCPVTNSTYEYLTAFITMKECNDNWEVNIKNKISSLLPDYMVPKKYIILDNMPLNSNGKIDRNKLKELIS